MTSGRQLSLVTTKQRLLRQLWDAARSDIGTVDDMQRVASRLSALVPGHVLATSSTPALPTKPALASLSRASIVKFAVLAVTLAGITGVVMLWSPAASRSVATTRFEAALPTLARTSASIARHDQFAPLPNAATSPAASSVAEARPERKSNRGRQPSSASSAASELQLNDDIALLLEARRSVTLDPDHTLACLIRHRAKFPRSSSAQERDVIEIDALMQLGHYAAARVKIEGFRLRFPGSAHLGRLNALADRIGQR